MTRARREPDASREAHRPHSTSARPPQFQRPRRLTRHLSRPLPRASSQYAEKTWKILRDAIREINNRNASGLSFEELYRNAYNMVLHRHGKALYDGLVDVVTEHLKEVAAAIDAVRGEGFLAELERRWQDHVKSMRMIRDILMYMDRIYVPPHGLKPVHDLGLALWRDHVVRNPGINARVRKAVLGAIEREREGERIDQTLVRAVTSMLMDVGEDVYVQDFEEHFLVSSTEFYRVESERFLRTSDCHEYLRRSERRLDEEHTRVKEYLNARTEPRLMAVVETELLSFRMLGVLGMANSGIRRMLADDKHDQLALVYKLYRHVDGGLGLAKAMMGEHVTEEGKALVTDPEKGKDPMAFVEGLLRMKAKYDDVIRLAFGGDRAFVNALHQAFEHFVNLNSRAPEYISLYVDERLRKGLKEATEEEIEASLDRTMSLFRFLQDKDAFERYYKQHLAAPARRTHHQRRRRAQLHRQAQDRVWVSVHEQDRGDVQRHAHQPRRDVVVPRQTGGGVHGHGRLRLGPARGHRPHRAGAHDGELAHPRGEMSPSATSLGRYPRRATNSGSFIWRVTTADGWRG